VFVPSIIVSYDAAQRKYLYRLTACASVRQRPFAHRWSPVHLRLRAWGVRTCIKPHIPCAVSPEKSFRNPPSPVDNML